MGMASGNYNDDTSVVITGAGNLALSTQDIWVLNRVRHEPIIIPDKKHAATGKKWTDRKQRWR